MLDYEKGLYVVIKELANGPQPFPLQHGFSSSLAYRVLGIYNPSESGECWLILSNDRDELWYIAQRHVRTWGLLASSRLLRVKDDTDFASSEADEHPPCSPPKQTIAADAPTALS